VNPYIIDRNPPRRADGTVDIRLYIAEIDAAINAGLPDPRTADDWALRESA
jgi:hypothetical protein